MLNGVHEQLDSCSQMIGQATDSYMHIEPNKADRVNEMGGIEMCERIEDIGCQTP